MSRRGKRGRLAFATLILITCVIGAVLGLRWKARQAALGYGLELQSALFDDQAPQVEGRPKVRRDIFNEAKMVGFEQTLRSPWNIVAADYLERAEDLRTGIVYLYIQLSQSSAVRFSHPPKLRHFKLETLDKSDDGVHAAIRTLMEDYLGAVGSR